MDQKYIIGIIVAVAVIGIVGVVALTRPAEQAQTIQVAGSTSVQPVAARLAEVYGEKHPNVKINVAAGGSSLGIEAAREGIANIGTSSRELEEDEKEGLKEFLIGRDGIVLVVHPENPVSDLTKDQIRGIYAGNITNWKDVGGPDATITVITREEGSGTRGAFEDIVMEVDDEEIEIKGDAIVQGSAEAIQRSVAGDPNAIGYVSLAALAQDVKALSVGGIAPSAETILDGTYEIQRPFLFLTKGEPTGAIKEFIDWVLSPEGQAVLKEEGIVPVK